MKLQVTDRLKILGEPVSGFINTPEEIREWIEELKSKGEKDYIGDIHYAEDELELSIKIHGEKLKAG